jgi:hypothetical protein
MMPKKDKQPPKRRFRVGDQIAFTWGPGDKVPGVVIEDRGNLGLGGRQIVRFRATLSPGTEPVEMEFDEDEVELVKAAP